MYISNHEQFTSSVVTNRKPLKQARGLFRSTNLYSAQRAFARVIMLVVLLTAAASFGAIVQAYAAQEQPKAYEENLKNGQTSLTAVHNGTQLRTVVVYRGDSLWSIAKEYAPSGTDIRSFISQMEKLNNLKSTRLVEGQALLLPAR